MKIIKSEPIYYYYPYYQSRGTPWKDRVAVEMLNSILDSRNIKVYTNRAIAEVLAQRWTDGDGFAKVFTIRVEPEGWGVFVCDDKDSCGTRISDKARNFLIPIDKLN